MERKARSHGGQRVVALKPGRMLAAALCALTASAQAETVQERAKTVTILGIASGTTAPNGVLFGSLSGSTKRDGVLDEVDGSAEIGYGMGSAENSLGLQLSVVTTSLTSSFGDSGYLSGKISRRLLQVPMPVYLGITADQLLPWGDSDALDEAGTIALTTFGTTTFGTSQEYPYMLTLGYGTDVQMFSQEPGVIFGAGIGLSRNFGLTAAWSGDTFDMGVALRVDQLEDVALGVVLNDVTDAQDSRRVTVSLSFAVDTMFGGVNQ